VGKKKGFFISNQISLNGKGGTIQIHEKYTKETPIKKKIKIKKIMSTRNMKTIIGSHLVTKGFEEKGL
jgi:hypothetical protein